MSAPKAPMAMRPPALPELKPGDEVLVSAGHGRVKVPAIVEKVGRIWVHLRHAGDGTMLPPMRLDTQREKRDSFYAYRFRTHEQQEWHDRDTANRQALKYRYGIEIRPEAALNTAPFRDWLVATLQEGSFDGGWTL